MVSVDKLLQMFAPATGKARRPRPTAETWNTEGYRSHTYMGDGGKLPSLGAIQGEKSPNRRCTEFFWLEICFFHVANWLWPYYVEHDNMFCCILNSNFGIRNLFFYPFSVKIMLKMNQKSVWRPGSPDPLAAIWGLLLRVGGGELGKGREGRVRESLNYTFSYQPRLISSSCHPWLIWVFVEFAYQGRG